MSSELNKIMRENIDFPSSASRFFKLIKTIRVTKREINVMRRILIDEIGPLYKKFTFKTSGKSPLQKFSIEQYENRIQTLPKGIVLEIYELWSKLKQAKEQDTKEYIYFILMMQISLSYGLHGWFLKKTLKRKEFLREIFLLFSYLEIGS